MPEVDAEKVGGHRLRTTTDHDFQVLISWIPDQRSCKLWAGPLVHFPLSVAGLKQDIAWRPENTLSLVDHRNALLGLGQLLIKPGKRIHLARVIVSPRYRGQGLGEKLCRLLMATGEKRYGRAAFTLNVYTANQRALNLYRKLGFRQRPSPNRFETDEACLFLVKGASGAPGVPEDANRDA